MESDKGERQSEKEKGERNVKIRGEEISQAVLNFPQTSKVQ